MIPRVVRIGSRIFFREALHVEPRPRFEPRDGSVMPSPLPMIEHLDVCAGDSDLERRVCCLRLSIVAPGIAYLSRRC